MTVVLFVTHFFKRKNTYSFLFSSAISEGIKDMFKEMGYSPSGVNKKENRKDQPSQNGQGRKQKSNPLMDN